jgi:hypothetical protein
MMFVIVMSSVGVILGILAAILIALVVKKQ